MKTNVGSLDKVARVSLGVAFLIVAQLVPMATLPYLVWISVSVTLLVTAFAGFCPLNVVLGINTAESDNRRTGDDQ
ncbi:MAG: DUF2892 domain-containing protein [Limisphaerales bacterium]